MTTKLLQMGIVGLGKMGANLALQAQEKGIEVVGYSLGGMPSDVLYAGAVEVMTFDGFIDELTSPRKIFLYIPAGPAVDDVIANLAELLAAGDIIVDGGNSYWGDSIGRYKRLKERGIEFVDLGTSGGMSGARHGACFMAGGDKNAFAQLEPILTRLAVPGGLVYAGPAGSGHFTKLVHNGIEFGMLQAIGEGMDLLKHFTPALDIDAILRCWRHGSVIRSWLIDLMEEASRDDNIDRVASYIEDTGEVNWLIADALAMEVPVPVIAQAVMQLFASRDRKKYAARAVALMRHGFGGHPFGPSLPIQKERKTGRINHDFVRNPE